MQEELSGHQEERSIMQEPAHEEESTESVVFNNFGLNREFLINIPNDKDGQYAHCSQSLYSPSLHEES